MEDPKLQLTALRGKLANLQNKLNVEKKISEIGRLTEESQHPEFWSNDQRARGVMQAIADLNGDVDELKTIETMLGDAETAIELGMEEEFSQKTMEVEKLIGTVEQKTYLSGPYDVSDAILTIHSGQGGVEAMDWAQMLLRMYQRLADKREWKWELTEEQAGEEAGIKSATLFIHGRHAYGYLRGERGTHRLVRQSPFNADHLRQTSFAMVEVMPVIEESEDIDIKPDELEFEAYRASGHGGQNVNKVSTAVRLRHIPSGITVESQSQRYQDQNRKIALQILRAKLWEIKEQKRLQKLREIKGDQTQASWGTQIRSYVLHPYKLVKDVRTNVESHNPEAVLDGNIDDFISAELRAL